MKKSMKETLASLKKQIAIQQNEIKHLTARLSMSGAAFLNIVGKSSNGVVIIDQRKMVMYTNYAAIQLFDRNIADLLGEPLAVDFDPKQLSDSDETTTEICIPKADGSQTTAEVSLFQTEWNKKPCYVVSFHDITERKKNEQMLQHMATHDFLTGLPNRVYFETQVTKALQNANNISQQIALIYLDLDDFKIINDTLGHNTGDQVLQKYRRYCNKMFDMGIPLQD